MFYYLRILCKIKPFAKVQYLIYKINVCAKQIYIILIIFLGVKEGWLTCQSGLNIKH